MTTKDKILIFGLLIIGLLSGIFLGRCSSPKPEPILNDNSMIISKMNNAIKEKNEALKEAEYHKNRFDSLAKVKIKSQLIIRYEKAKIPFYTPNQLRRWDDSVLRANGYR